MKIQHAFCTSCGRIVFASRIPPRPIEARRLRGLVACLFPVGSLEALGASGRIPGGSGMLLGGVHIFKRLTPPRSLPEPPGSLPKGSQSLRGASREQTCNQASEPPSFNLPRRNARSENKKKNHNNNNNNKLSYKKNFSMYFQ